MGIIRGFNGIVRRYSIAVAVLSTVAISKAPAQTSSGNVPSTGSTVDEVVVTAEKSSRSLRNTASSVVVTRDTALDSLAGTYTTDALLERIPNLVVSTPSNSAPAVRGVDGTGPAVGANAFFAGTRPRLNYQVDGRTLGFNDSLYLDAALWDVQQVEVYRGAQSTLQGRNAIAGVIAIRTKDPTFDWQGSARVLGGNEAERQVSAALSGPIVDQRVAFRLAADYRHTQSFTAFTGYPADHDPGRFDSLALRGKLLLVPADTVRSLLTFSYNDARSPQTENILAPYDKLVAAAPQQPVFRARTYTLISDTDWHLSDLVTLEADVSGSSFRVDRYAPAGMGIAAIDAEEVTLQPFIRAHTASESLSGFLAAYVFRTHQDEVIDLFGGGHFADRTRTTAIFGEGTLKLASSLDLTVGARYEEEQRHRVGRDGPFVIDFDATYKEFLPKTTLSWRATAALTVGVTAGRGYNAGGAGFTFAAPFVSYEYQPELVWDYEGFVRAVLLDRRLTLTGNVFLNRYHDLQLPFSLSSLSTVIRNAERATTYGAEAGVEYRMSVVASVFANLGTLKTRVDRYTDPTVQGNDLARSPAFTSDVGFSIVPMPRWAVAADVRYTDAYYSDATNSARGKTSPYAIANAQLSYEWSRVRAFLACRNVFDTRKPTFIVPGATPALDSAVLVTPRTYTLGLQATF